MHVTRIHKLLFLPEPYHQKPGPARAVKILDAARHHLGDRHIQVAAAWTIDLFAVPPEDPKDKTIQEWFTRRNHQARVAHNIIDPILRANEVHPAQPEMAVIEWAITGRAEPLQRLANFGKSTREWLRIEAAGIIEMMCSDPSHPQAYRPFSEHFQLVTNPEQVANIVILRPDPKAAREHVLALHKAQALLDAGQLTTAEFQTAQETIGIDDPKDAVGFLYGGCASDTVYDSNKNYATNLRAGDHQVPLELFGPALSQAADQPIESESL